jgi:hypothetical protein
VEKFRELPLKDVTCELESPTEKEKSGRKWPHTPDKNRDWNKNERQDNDGNAEQMAHAIYRMLMAAAVFLNPLIRGLIGC